MLKNHNNRKFDEKKLCNQQDRGNSSCNCPLNVVEVLIQNF